MSEVYVEYAKLPNVGNKCKAAATSIQDIRGDLRHTISRLDWDVKSQEKINQTANSIARKLEGYSSALIKYRDFLNDAKSRYQKLDTSNENLADLDKISTVAGYAAAAAATDYTTENTSKSTSASGSWLGYETDDNHPGVTAWIGKGSATVSGDDYSAGVNAYVGKAEAEAKAKFKLISDSSKSKYKDGKWKDSDSSELLAAELAASASASVAAVDAKFTSGDDMLGVEGKAEGSIGSTEAEAKAKVSVGDDGINANVKAKAMVSAAEGKVSGTVNILGIEITANVGGYAGAIGAEGKAGIEDNKFVLEGGVAALIGVSADIEVGINEEGWNNFVDFVTFWD